MAEPSLIPKTYPVAGPEVRSGLGVLTFLGIVLFVLALLIAGGVFFYKRILERQTQELSRSLERLEADFEPSLIRELSRTAKALEVGERLVGERHFASRFFNFLEERTLTRVRFRDLKLQVSEGGVTLGGEAEGYTVLAEQASVFETSPLVQTLALANLALKENGNINFTMELTFDPSLMSSP